MTLSTNIPRLPAFSRDYLVHYYEIGRDSRLTLPALMHYFEDIATLNSEANRLPLDYYWRTGQVFLLLKWDIVIRSWPRFNETVRIETRPTSFKKFLANRKYTVYTTDDQWIAEARSVWIFTDMTAKKPARIPAEIPEAFGVPPESEASFYSLEDLPEIAGDAPAIPFSVGKRDLDNNGHVNNVRYVEWALESLPEDFTHSRAVGRVKIHYKKELREGDEATLLTIPAQSDDGAVSDHSFRAKDQELCRLHLEWTKI